MMFLVFLVLTTVISQSYSEVKILSVYYHNGYHGTSTCQEMLNFFFKRKAKPEILILMRWWWLWPGNSQLCSTVPWLFVSQNILWLVGWFIRDVPVLGALWRNCVPLSHYIFFICREFSARVANQETYLFCLRVMVGWFIKVTCTCTVYPPSSSSNCWKFSDQEIIWDKPCGWTVFSFHYSASILILCCFSFLSRLVL